MSNYDTITSPQIKGPSNNAARGHQDSQNYQEIDMDLEEEKVNMEEKK